MMTSAASPLVASLAVALAAIVVYAGPPAPENIKKALVEWAEHNIFSLDPVNNQLETIVPHDTRVAEQKGSLTGVGQVGNPPVPVVFFGPYTALQVAEQLEVCKNFHSKCESVINEAIIKKKIRSPTASCKELAAALKGDAAKWCSAKGDTQMPKEDHAKVLPWMIKHLQRQYLHFLAGTTYNFMKFVAGEKCFKILYTFPQNELLLSTNDLAQSIPECQQFVSEVYGQVMADLGRYTQACKTIVQQFADSRKNDGKKYSCADLARETGNDKRVSVLCSAEGWVNINT